MELVLYGLELVQVGLLLQASVSVSSSTLSKLSSSSAPAPIPDGDFKGATGSWADSRFWVFCPTSLTSALVRNSFSLSK